MAFSARELVLILRATNQASGPLRQVSRDLRSLGSSGATAGRSVDQLANRKRWGQFGLASAVLRDTGRSARIMGIAAGAGLAFAAKGAADFNKQATLVATQAGTVSGSFLEVEKNAKKIEQGLLAIMPNATASMDDLSESAYEIFSSTNLGAQGAKGLSDGLKLVDLFSKAAIAGQTDLTKVTQAGVTVFNSFGKEAGAMPVLLNRMFAAVRFGRFTFEQLSSSMSQVAPAAVNAGQSFDEIMGAMAFLSRHIPQVGMMRTALARSLEMLNMPDFVAGMKKMGVSIRDTTGRMRPLNQVIADIVKKNPKLAEGRQTIEEWYKAVTAEGGGGKGRVGTIQGRRALVFLMRFQKQYQRILGQTTGQQNAFNRALVAMERTTGVKWDKMVNQLKAMFLLIGTLAIPVLTEMLKPLNDLFQWFRKLDPETQKQIVRWTAMGVAIAIVGGTLASLIGNIGTIVAALKLGGGSLTMVTGLLFGLSAVFLLLIGQGDMLRAAFENIFEFATQDIMHMVAALGVLYVAMVRLSVAGKGMMGIPLLMGARTGAGNMRAGMQLVGGAAGVAAASRMSTAGKVAAGAWAATKASIMLLPGPLKVAAALTAAIAGGAYLWSRNNKKAADEAKRAADLLNAASRPVRAANQVAGFGMAARDFEQQEINVGRLGMRIVELRRAIKGATGEERKMLQLDLRQALLDRAVSMANYTAAANRMTRASSGVANSIRGVAANLMGIQAKQGRIDMLREQIAGLQGVVGKGGQIRAYREEIARLSQEIVVMQNTSVKAGTTLTRGIGQSLRDLKAAAMIKFPMQDFAKIREAVSRVALERGRMLKLPEIKQVINAVLDRGSLTKMPADIKRAIGTIKINAMVDIQDKIVKQQQRKVAESFHTEMGGREGTGVTQAQVKLRGASEALAQSKALRGRLAKQFQKAIVQTVKVKVDPPDTSGLGLAISMGVAAGIYAGIPAAVTAAQSLMAQTQAAASQSIEAKSPYRLFKRTIGIPIVQGIIAGILSKAGDAADAAVFVLDQIEGKSLAKMTSMMKKQAATIRGMNTNLQTLVNRKVPMQLVEQLAQMGTEGAAQMKKLANASKTELNAFVNAWRRAQSAVNASARFNWTRLTEFVDAGAQKLLDIYNTARDTMQSFLMGALQDSTKIAGEIADSVASAFGQLFQGPMNISEHIGEAFDSAMDSYRSSMAGLQEQMEELQQRQADTIADFMERRRDELRNAFGKLFSGPILSAGFQAGSVKDLIADLNRQLADFQNWRKNLDILASKGVPPALMKALEELGPEASQNMSLLVNATDAELAEWVAAWQAGQGAIEQVTQSTYMNMEGFAEAMADIAEQMAKVAQQMASLQAPKRADFAMLLADLNAQKLAWADYNAILTMLHDKGVPALLLSELAKLGVEGVDILRILNSGTQAELDAYVTSWLETQGQIKIAKDGWLAAIAPEEILAGLQDTTTQLKTWGDNLAFIAASGMSPAIVAELRKLGPESAALIAGIAQGIKDDPAGFVEKFSGLWTTAQTQIDADAKIWVNEQIALWKTHGTNIALGIIAGVMEEQGKLFTFFRGLFSQLLQEAKKETKTSSPSMVYFELGRNIVQGFQNGLNSMTPTLAMPGAGSITGGAFSHRAGSGINMTVNAHHSESLQSTLERTSFRMRQRRVN